MQRLAALTLTMGASLTLISCESVDSRRAGGAAFDDTPMARTLDSSAVVPDDEELANRSFEAWRSLD